MASASYLTLLCSIHCWLLRQFFYNHCNIMGVAYKGVSGWVGGQEGVDGQDKGKAPFY